MQPAEGVAGEGAADEGTICRSRVVGLDDTRRGDERRVRPTRRRRSSKKSVGHSSARQAAFRSVFADRHISPTSSCRRSVWQLPSRNQSDSLHGAPELDFAEPCDDEDARAHGSSENAGASERQWNEHTSAGARIVGQWRGGCQHWGQQWRERVGRAAEGPRRWRDAGLGTAEGGGRCGPPVPRSQLCFWPGCSFFFFFSTGRWGCAPNCRFGRGGLQRRWRQQQQQHFVAHRRPRRLHNAVVDTTRCCRCFRFGGRGRCGGSGGGFEGRRCRSRRDDDESRHSVGKRSSSRVQCQTGRRKKEVRCRLPPVHLVAFRRLGGKGGVAFNTSGSSPLSEALLIATSMCICFFLQLLLWALSRPPRVGNGRTRGGYHFPFSKWNGWRDQLNFLVQWQSIQCWLAIIVCCTPSCCPPSCCSLPPVALPPVAPPPVAPLPSCCSPPLLLLPPFPVAPPPPSCCSPPSCCRSLPQPLRAGPSSLLFKAAATNVLLRTPLCCLTAPTTDDDDDVFADGRASWRRCFQRCGGRTKDRATSRRAFHLFMAAVLSSLPLQPHMGDKTASWRLRRRWRLLWGPQPTDHNNCTTGLRQAPGRNGPACPDAIANRFQRRN